VTHIPLVCVLSPPLAISRGRLMMIASCLSFLLLLVLACRSRASCERVLLCGPWPFAPFLSFSVIISASIPTSSLRFPTIGDFLSSVRSDTLRRRQSTRSYAWLFFCAPLLFPVLGPWLSVPSSEAVPCCHIPVAEAIVVSMILIVLWFRPPR
jgi:hypothetical protein